MTRVAVALGADLSNVGEFVADARAFDTAGADSLWVRADAPLDPWLLLAAIAAITYRARLATDAPPRDDRVRRTLETLSRGRLLTNAFVHEGDDVAAAKTAFAGALAKDPKRECWALLSAPRDRAHWREVRAAYEAIGATGVMLRNDPRLLDLVRNPDVDDDRSDLRIAVG